MADFKELIDSIRKEQVTLAEFNLQMQQNSD